MSPGTTSDLPGTQHRYSGGGTTIMQLMLMDLLGQPFPQIMRELVLDPLGMEHSTYVQPLLPVRARSAATGHPGDCRPVDGRWHVYPEMAAAGLWTYLTWRGWREAERPLVVIARDGVPLARGNGPTYPPNPQLPQLNRGMEARLLHNRGGWVQLQFPGGEIGWLPRQAVVTE